MLRSVDRAAKARPLPGHKGKKMGRLGSVLGLALLIVVLSGGPGPERSDTVAEDAAVRNGWKSERPVEWRAYATA